MIDNEKMLNEFILINNNVDRSHISYNYDLLKILSENIKIKLIGILYQNIKYYLKI